MRRFFLLGALAAAGVAVPLALAATTATDPNDTRGNLDIKSVAATRDGQLLRMTIRTYDSWPSTFLQGRNARSGPIGGRNALSVLYDVNKNGRADYTGRILYFGHTLAIWISGRRSRFEPVKVKHHGGTVTFTHPVDVFFRSPGRKTVNIAVTSVDRTSSGCSSGCRDRAPNHGWIKVVFPHIA